ncbi:MAG: VOC family protein [Bifidobacteriaceae bacterium]|jgi:catechol 2,3-dioxygenase-like lactoylglutathione lyase family enzyme|nr:VOC family protein [Bifidobacteriaceae bacterium]
MTIKSVAVNTTDLKRSVAFYTAVLGAGVVSQTETKAVLDLYSGNIEISLVPSDPSWSTWRDDSQQAGFRHIGFKVPEVDPVAEAARAAGAMIRIEPLDAFGDVRLAFFFDPDGTLLEVVEKDLMYTDIAGADTVAFERSLGVPPRPRLDHVACTTVDLHAAVSRWEARGLHYMGQLTDPAHPRGFQLHYVRDQGTVVELMTFTGVGVYPRAPQVGVPGFGAALVDTDLPPGCFSLGSDPQGREIFADQDSLTIARL